MINIFTQCATLIDKAAVKLKPRVLPDTGTGQTESNRVS